MSGRQPEAHFATIIVPTRNEAHTIQALLVRLDVVLRGTDAEILFVDDSTDGTRDEVARVARSVDIPVRVLARDASVGGLGGAVLAGIAASSSDWCVIMDGDLQHPPESVPDLLAATTIGSVDLVVGSRHVPGGSSRGLANGARRWLSAGSTAIVHLLFPHRLAGSTDPLSGFFAVRREAINPAALRPRGFKILLEILIRSKLRVVEIPLVLEPRRAGTSKGDLRQGVRLATQIAILRLAGGAS